MMTFSLGLCTLKLVGHVSRLSLIYLFVDFGLLKLVG